MDSGKGQGRGETGPYVLAGQTQRPAVLCLPSHSTYATIQALDIHSCSSSFCTAVSANLTHPITLLDSAIASTWSAHLLSKLQVPSHSSQVDLVDEVLHAGW